MRDSRSKTRVRFGVKLRVVEKHTVRTVVNLKVWPIVLAALSGCVQLHIVSGDAVEVTREWGLVWVSVSAQKNPTYVATDGLGLVFGQRNLTLGWLKERVALFPDPGRCAVLIVAESVTDVEAITKLLEASNRNLGSICITGG
jgi:hypothetical protein